MENFGQNLRSMRKERGMSMADLAERIGTSRQTVHRYESGVISNVPPERVEAIAATLGTSPSRLMGWGVEKQRHGSMHAVPMLGEIACGAPLQVNEEYDSYVMANSGIQADFCLRAKGDSMEEARIYDGDIVFVRSQDIVDEGDIAAVIIDDEATLKRVYYNREEERIVLMPANPRYAPLIYSGEQLSHIRILGKAVAFQSAL